MYVLPNNFILRILGNLKKIPEMLTFLLENRKNSAVKLSTEKPILLNLLILLNQCYDN